MELSDNEPILEATLLVPDHVVHRSFDAETLLLNLQSGQYHGVNATGGRLLELLGENGGDAKSAVRALAQEFEVEVVKIEQDMAEFCRSLADRGLLEVVERAGS